MLGKQQRKARKHCNLEILPFLPYNGNLFIIHRTTALFARSEYYFSGPRTITWMIVTKEGTVLQF